MDFDEFDDVVEVPLAQRLAKKGCATGAPAPFAKIEGSAAPTQTNAFYISGCLFSCLFKIQYCLVEGYIISGKKQNFGGKTSRLVGGGGLSLIHSFYVYCNSYKPILR